MTESNATAIAATHPTAPSVVVNLHDDPERDRRAGVILSKYNLNFQRQPRDPRDLRFGASLITAPINEASLPKAVDLRQNWKIVDQGPLGSCVANSVCGCIRFVRIKEKRTVYDPSRLFVYYYGRVIEGCVSEDTGLYVRDAYKCAPSW